MYHVNLISLPDYSIKKISFMNDAYSNLWVLFLSKIYAVYNIFYSFRNLKGYSKRHIKLQ